MVKQSIDSVARAERTKRWIDVDVNFGVECWKRQINIDFNWVRILFTKLESISDLLTRLYCYILFDWDQP